MLDKPRLGTLKEEASLVADPDNCLVPDELAVIEDEEKNLTEARQDILEEKEINFLGVAE